MKKIRLAVILFVMIIAGILVYQGPWQRYKIKMSENILKSALVSQISTITGLSDEQTEDIINVIPPDQQNDIVRIAAEHITPSSVKKVVELAESSDGSTLLKYAEQEFSPGEIKEVEQIVLDNRDAVMEKLAEYGVSAGEIEDLLVQGAG